ncbi:bacitracin ABC transporter ATP-binding protein [Paenibacillus albidus]|uniref:Bacitracin ABC transporter ATP-binding protein n=1 Tax=Paenibacillus albidus TaxID=2041023 RepID=A0A917CXG9_9BACL|nr:ABC transporter ATP-binding protein [Paenibacillus albidus]GGG01386.1 bacitracin ABC transporter ATP-binding protein [Paenibacillus albidus]
MTRYVLRTDSLTKSYRSSHALHEVSLTLEAGKIYGLIGQNGAGKTTFMRLVAGLGFPTSGSIELFGARGEKALQVERKRLGCMIEHPSLTPGMSARDNLRLHRILRGIPNEEVEEELLAFVGLSDTGSKKAKNFSLGMKQRLGIAVALLGNPEMLILDEPVNGLDPVGVVEIRKLLKKLCDERQMTILLSSHNLPELYQTASDYIIIHQGKVKETLTLAQLEERCKRHILISSGQPEQLASVLEMKLNTTHYKVLPDHTVKLYDYLDDNEKVSRVLYDNGIRVTNLSVAGDTLEDYFMTVVGGAKSHV